MKLIYRSILFLFLTSVFTNFSLAKAKRVPVSEKDQKEIHVAIATAKKCYDENENLGDLGDIVGKVRDLCLEAKEDFLNTFDKHPTNSELLEGLWYLNTAIEIDKKDIEKYCHKLIKTLLNEYEISGHINKYGVRYCPEYEKAISNK